MANLFTSELIQPENNLVELLIDRISLDSSVALEVFKYSNTDTLLGKIVPPTTYVENGGCPEDKTRIRVFLSENQLEQGEKVQLQINN